MKKSKYVEAQYLGRMKRLFYRAMACMLCIPIWVFTTEIGTSAEQLRGLYYIWPFSCNGDLYGVGILMLVALLFSIKHAVYQLKLWKVK